LGDENIKDEAGFLDKPGMTALGIGMTTLELGMTTLELGMTALELGMTGGDRRNYASEKSAECLGFFLTISAALVIAPIMSVSD
jgi:hypothetical protein